MSDEQIGCCGCLFIVLFCLLGWAAIGTVIALTIS
jgi:hypothetical protein